MEGEVEFVSDSEATLTNYVGSDLSIVQAAVVSTGLDASEWPEERVAGLVNRLMKDRHGVPFEHVVLTFLIKTPIFTARQLMRHRLASWNEASARYKVIPARYYVPPQTRPIKQTGKTMDYEFHVDEALASAAQVVIMQASKAGQRAYQTLLESGVAKEVARMVLPVNAMTELIVTINLRSLFNFLSLRGEQQGTFPSHPQFEIVQVAKRMEAAVAEVAPLAYQSFVTNGRVAP